MTQPTRNQILGTGLLTGVALLAALPGILKKLDGTTRSVVLVSGALGTAMATKATTDWCNLPEKIFWTILTHAAIYGAAAAMKSKKFIFTLRGAAWLAGAQVVGILIPHWVFAKKVERHPDDPANQKLALFVYRDPDDKSLIEKNLPLNVDAEFKTVDEFRKVELAKADKMQRIFIVYLWRGHNACIVFRQPEGRFQKCAQLANDMLKEDYDIHLLIIRPKNSQKLKDFRLRDSQPELKGWSIHQFERPPISFLRLSDWKDPALKLVDKEEFHKLVLGENTNS